jgi:hypothetical protein
MAAAERLAASGLLLLLDVCRPPLQSRAHACALVADAIGEHRLADLLMLIIRLNERQPRNGWQSR